MNADKNNDNKGLGFSDPPSINLPRGGGSIRGMGEKFATNPVTGTGSMTIPIATSPGRAGFGPDLSVSYNSGAGNGPFGFGWSMSIPSISRKTDKGLPRYRDTKTPDTFILSGAEDLAPLSVQATAARQNNQRPVTRRVNNNNYVIQYFRPRIEGLFARIECWTREDDADDIFWRSISRDNITSWYGKTPASRIFDPSDAGRVFSWLICESHDDRGNVIIYQYQPEDSTGVDVASAHEVNRSDVSRSSNKYIKRIFYGNYEPYFPRLVTDQSWPSALTSDPPSVEHPYMFEIVFDYGEHDAVQPVPNATGEWDCRRDPFSSYRAGFEIRTYRLCQRVLMFHHFPEEQTGSNYLVRSTDFSYACEQNADSPQSAIYTFLCSAHQSGYKKLADGTTRQKSLPPLEFSYSKPEISHSLETLNIESQENLPEGLDGNRYQWIDLDGTGLSGILTEQGNGWFYKRNLSPGNTVAENNTDRTVARFAPLQQLASQPSLAALNSGQQRFLDLAGDGQPDLAFFEGPTPGFYERSRDEDWELFKYFESLPVLDWGNPDLKFIDLNGDGHADILISEDEAFCWYPSLAESGFGPSVSVSKSLDEETSPRVVFADGSQSIYLSDLSGDGLSDIVRIRNGEICYWPNLGYGCFGDKVNMDNAPWFDHDDQFNQQRIRLVDIDGSGTTDMIYLGRTSIQIFYNESGNSWSAPQTLNHFPKIDNLATVIAVDLLGNGTACLLWSSPLSADAHQPMRYLNLMGENKPHLLTEVANNLGALTRIHYAPSTKFYLQDQQQGWSWISKIPFPVYVVESVETIDQISNSRFTTQYAYHHGYFDGIEREFRGFGVVDQWDSEEYADLEGNQDLLDYDNIGSSMQLPAVHTRTWFHTGFYTSGDKISLQYLHEYFGAPEPEDPDYEAKLAAFEKTLLADTILPDNLTAQEQREACRALKGSMLRQEIYADDGTDKAKFPYTVREQNFSVRLLQSGHSGRHSVYLSHAREAISYHFERNPQYPRISHTMTLEVDNFDNALKAIEIGYGRCQPDERLSEDDQKKQTQTHIIYSENQVTNNIKTDDDYRTPLPCEASSYQITGLTPEENTLLFSFDYFSDNNFSVLSDLSEIEYEQPPVPQGKQKRLIEQVDTRYRGNDMSALLEVGLLESRALPGESYQLAFTPGLLEQVYPQSAMGLPVGELGQRGGYVDLHGNGRWWIPSGRAFFSTDEDDSSVVELEMARQHFYMVTRYRDAFGYSQIIDFDYDLLIRQTRDALGNTFLADNDFRVLQPKQITDPNGNRTELAFDVLGMVEATAVMGKEGEINPDKTGDTLDNPTTHLEYELFAWRNHGQPNFVRSYAREQHGQANPRWQESYLYSDGFGRELQSKVQAEPGDAPQREPVATNPYRPGDLLRDEYGKPLLAHSEQRWVGSGRTVYNNKGKPVKKYEPFFSSTQLYEDEAELVETGVTTILFYDPMERAVATLHPNKSWEKIVFDAWKQESWDVNDTVLQEDPKDDPDMGSFFQRLPDADYLPTWYTARIDGDMGAEEQDAAHKTEAHADTPGIAYLDTLGRTFLSIADNGPDANGTEQKYATRVELDIEGNQRSVKDARGNMVMQVEYDMLGNPVYQNSMDAGKGWTFANVMGNPVYSWKMALDNEMDDWHSDQDFLFRNSYDALHRPTESWVKKGAESERLTDKTLYGESVNEAASNNLRGQPYQAYDQAGLVENMVFDFKGNLLQSTRRLAGDYKTVVDWNGADPSVLLQDELFELKAEFDALNRVVKTCSPHNPQIPASEIIPVYSEANLLNEVRVRLRGSEQETVYVKNIDYDAKGQRECIRYGNDVITEYSYDPDTFRLTHLITTGNNSVMLQDLHYSYDPVGNITRIRDDAQQTNYFNNDVVPPHAAYVYDAIYRLIEANGREHIGQNTPVGPHDTARINHNLPGDANAMRRYKQGYEYDEAGNISKMIHHAGNGVFQHRWTRSYNTSQSNNRLLNTTVGNETSSYGHDSHGNMSMPYLTLMQWDYQDQLQATSRQVVNNGGTAETTYYVYDAAGQRVRKVTENQAVPGETPTKKNERIYLGGFEIFRTYQENSDIVDLERETLHIMDDRQRIALVETRTRGDEASPQQLLRYQLNNHLGSSSLELDDSAAVISYEEYYPYGGSSYQAVDKAIKVAAKRYRYTGKERDDETGLYYYGARYYAAWLGRWVSCDPIGVRGSVNVFQFVKGNPIKFFDNTGLQPEEKSNQVDLIEIAPRAGSELSIAGIKPGESSNDKFQSRSNLPKKSAAPLTVGRSVSDKRAEVERDYQNRLQRNILKGKPPPKQKLLRTFQPKTKKIEPFSLEDLELSIKAVGVVLSMSYEATDYLFPWWTDISAGGINVGRKYFLNPKVKSIVSRPLSDVLVGTSREQMLRSAARKIDDVDNHPLQFLLDPLTIGTKKPKFKRPPGRSHSTLINHPDVIEAGHIISNKAGGAEHLMIQNAWLNQFSNLTVEGVRRGGADLGMFIKNVAIDIGGIAVDLLSARMWEQLSLLVEGTVNAARRLQF